MKKTDELLKILKNSHDIDGFLGRQEFIEINLPQYLCEVINKRGISKADVIKRSGIDRVYGYQILNGTKTPSRDKLIQFAFGIQLDFDEVQKLLKYNGFAPLYAQNRRDSIIIFALKENLSVIDLNILLDEKDEKILE